MNCANSFCFHVYLMLHTCAVRFDVTENLEKFCELNKALLCSAMPPPRLESAILAAPVREEDLAGEQVTGGTGTCLLQGLV